MRSVQNLARAFVATTCLLFVADSPRAAEDAAKGQPLTLRLRSQVEIEPGSGRYRVETAKKQWDPAKTAAVVCDMWDSHWSANASARVAEMAPRMNELLTALRARGVLIIHCPSDTMDFYKDTPQRARAQAAPEATPKVPLQKWVKLDPAHEPPLPIDDTDGGDDSEPPSKTRKAWTRQIAALAIAPEDAITDSAEAYNLIRQRGIENVLVMGVHLNMCVLGRPFAIRQLARQGLNVALVRDLTDTMYNPKKAPFVSHFTGTDLMIDHVERHWCPTLASSDVLGGSPLRFSADHRPTLAIIAAEDEYKSEKTLPEFALKQLGRDFRVLYVFANPADYNSLPGIAEALDQADMALFCIRRKGLPEADLAAVRRFVAKGKPVVGVRTAPHSFAPFAKKPLPPDRAFWPEFDREVLGCVYNNHHKPKETVVKVIPEAAGHPILSGITRDEVKLPSTLYLVLPLAQGATPLMMGTTPGASPEPVAWTWTRPDGGRTFNTTLGHPDEFSDPTFVRLLRNGIYWSAGLPIPSADPATASQ